jgi:hypothetical protein
LGQARLNKLKLVQDAKLAWRKEKAAKLEAHKQSIEDGDDDDMLDGPVESDHPGPTTAPEVVEVDFGLGPAIATPLPQAKAIQLVSGPRSNLRPWAS